MTMYLPTHVSEPLSLSLSLSLSLARALWWHATSQASRTVTTQHSWLEPAPKAALPRCPPLAAAAVESTFRLPIAFSFSVH